MTSGGVDTSVHQWWNSHLILHNCLQWNLWHQYVSLYAYMSTSHQFFMTSSIGGQCLGGYSSKLLHWLFTASEALGLPTLVALPAQSQAILVSARPTTVIVPRTRTTRLRRWSFFIAAPCSSCLELIFAPRPSVAVISELAQDLSFQAGLSLTFSLRTIEDVELNCVCV